MTLVVLMVLGMGCRSYRSNPYRDLASTFGNDTTCIDAIMCEVNVGAPPSPEPSLSAVTSPPKTLRNLNWDTTTFRELSLSESIEIALSHSQVLRDLGARVLRNPATVATSENRPLVETDPQASRQAALSAFDAQFYVLGKWQNNDRRFNNRFFGGGANAFQQDTHDYVFQISKRTATGAQFSLRSVTDYDANNATGNNFPSAWQSQLHAEARQPLLQGGGLSFNRIAGPGAQPGVYNGVLIANVNNDITAAEFREQTRDYLSNVVNAYWDLYFAYRDLDAKRQSLGRARDTWQSYEAQKTSNRRTGAAEALAREQYFRFESEMQDALAGKLVQRTASDNATTGGNFAGVGGVMTAERRLRLLIGLPINEADWLRPSDEPHEAPLIFDWDSISAEAIRMRSELQQQRLLVQRRKMELLAAKNFLMPSLDLVTIYRLRGLDHHLAGSNSALSELGTGDFQEYEANLELRMPVGFRQAHAAVRHAKFQISRAEAVLQEQQRQVLHDLAAVVADCDRAWTQSHTSMNRYLAASEALEVLEANRQAGLPVNLEQLLDAQRRISEAQTRYHLAMVEYTIAAKNVQVEKGTLLETMHMWVVGESAERFVAMPERESAEAPELLESALGGSGAE